FAVGVYTAANKDNPVYRLARKAFHSTQDQEPSNRSYWRQKVDIYRQSLDHGDVAMVGDSITDHGEWTEMFPGENVVNRGISGDTTGGLLQRLDTIAAEQVFVLIGINDILLGIDQDEIVANYR